MYVHTFMNIFNSEENNKKINKVKQLIKYLKTQWNCDLGLKIIQILLLLIFCVL